MKSKLSCPNFLNRLFETLVPSQDSCRHLAFDLISKVNRVRSFLFSDHNNKLFSNYLKIPYRREKMTADKKRKMAYDFIAKSLLISIAIVMTFAFTMPIVFAQGACFPGTSCRGTAEICDTQTCIDASGRTETTFSNCKPTGLTTAVCPDGTPVTCQNTCEEGIGGPTVKQCNVNQN